MKKIAIGVFGFSLGWFSAKLFDRLIPYRIDITTRTEEQQLLTDCQTQVAEAVHGYLLRQYFNNLQPYMIKARIKINNTDDSYAAQAKYLYGFVCAIDGFKELIKTRKMELGDNDLLLRHEIENVIIKWLRENSKFFKTQSSS